MRVVPTTGPSSCGSSRPARRRTARTGRSSAGSVFCRCAGSRPSVPPSRPTSSMSRTGPGRCPCSRSHRTGRTRGGGKGSSAGSPTRGAPSSGSVPPRSSRRDPYARFFYVDTFNSVFGSGWRHDAGKVAHSRNGAFCYSFVPQFTPPGYPTHELRPPGNGDRHRVTVMGPGVTPVIQWEGAALGRYDPQQDAVYNALFDRLVGAGDRVCVPER